MSTLRIINFTTEKYGVFGKEIISRNPCVTEHAVRYLPVAGGFKEGRRTYKIEH
jgi:hypothetical protein